MGVEFRGAPPPGGGPGVFIPILSLRVGETLDVTFLEEVLHAAWTHFDYDAVKQRERSYGCTAHYERCPRCGKRPKVWQAYAAVWNHKTGLRSAFAFAHQGALAVRAAAEKRGCLTMGRFLLTRASSHPQSTVRVVPSIDTSPTRVQPHDIRPVIKAALGLRVLIEDMASDPAAALAALESDENGGVL